MSVLKPGEQVVILPPYDADPIIIAMQHFATVVDSVPDGYLVRLGSTYPVGESFGPFPLTRLARGWRDERGRWRVG